MRVPITGGSLPGRALRRCFITLGLSDDDGNLSFNKFVTLGLLTAFFIILLRRLTPDPAVLAFGIFVGVCGFGLKAVMSYLEHLSITNTFSSQTTTNLKGDLSEMIRAVKERKRATLEGTQDTQTVPQVRAPDAP